MININYGEFLNEEMAVISTRKLRDAMHDIIVGLPEKDSIDVEDMTKTLMNDYKITISPFFLDKFLDDFINVRKGVKNTETFFTPKDIRWLGIREVKGSKEMRNNLNHLRPALTKHKRKRFIDDERQKLDDIYKTGMKDLNFTEDVIKKSLILQKPEDSKDIMKYIYNDVIITKKYDNTYDNCWKLMMLLGKQNKLDRVKGWFKLAPQKVKDKFYSSKEGEPQINYDLTKPSKNQPIKNTNPKRDTNTSSETEKNLKIVDDYLDKYQSWGHLLRGVKLPTLIQMLDDIKARPVADQGNKLNEFVAKIDQLTLILTKFYQVDRRHVIQFYSMVGLAPFIKKWQSTGNRPKINEF